MSGSLLSRPGCGRRDVHGKVTRKYLAKSPSSSSLLGPKRLPHAVARKSLSSLNLSNLSPAQKTKFTIHRRRLLKMSEDIPKCTSKPNLSLTLNDADTKRALKVYSVFLKKAWTSSREKIASLEEKVSSLEQKVHSLNIQNVSLKTLLQSDTETAAASAKEIHKLKFTITALSQNIDKLTEEKNILEENTRKLEAEVDQLRTENINEVNTTKLALSEANALETQLVKEREKIARLKEEKNAAELKNSLLDKVNKETLMTVKNLKMSLEKAELESNQRLKMWETLSEHMKKSEVIIKDMEKKSSSMKKEIDVALANNKWLQTHNRKLEDDIKRKSLELSKLEDHNREQIMQRAIGELKEHFKRETPVWSNSITTTVMKVFTYALLERI